MKNNNTLYEPYTSTSIRSNEPLKKFQKKITRYKKTFATAYTSDDVECEVIRSIHSESDERAVDDEVRRDERREDVANERWCGDQCTRCVEEHHGYMYKKNVKQMKRKKIR